MYNIEIYLWVNAVLYAVFAIWCLLLPATAGNFTGLTFINTSGRSEFFALYIGLEAAWAIMFALAAIKPEWQYFGILYAVFMYAGLVVGRWISIFQKGISSNMTYLIAILEIILGTWAVVILLNHPLS